MKTLYRAQWPHTVDDIRRALDGVWGIVGATGTNGNLLRLERSLHEPLRFTLTEYRGAAEEIAISTKVYDAAQKEDALRDFSLKLGFDQESQA
jgi:hypothetical protein